jgi:MoaA/NifB/PqqE/SkfB family radical SAM enzyme
MSCNLSCPSCLKIQFIEQDDRAKSILKIEKDIENNSKSLKMLYISGSGDPFGSPYSRRFLMRMTQHNFPALERIYFHCNGPLFTQRNWEKFPDFVTQRVRNVEISLDGCSKVTIEQNRRGTHYEKLMKNLDYISQLKKEGVIKHLRLSFVVQENNFHEMVYFVRLGVQLHADEVFFSKILNWGSFSESEYHKKAIHLKEHPLHQKLLSVLAEDAFDHRCVELGNLQSIRQDRLCSVPPSYFMA